MWAIIYTGNELDIIMECYKLTQANLLYTTHNRIAGGPPTG
jgi:hypothetical protein